MTRFPVVGARRVGHGILLGGNRRLQGMPVFAGEMSVEDADAIHAHAIDRAWELYERSGNGAD